MGYELEMQEMQEMELSVAEYNLDDILQKSEEIGKELDEFVEENTTYITKRKTAEILGVTERTVDNYVKNGYLKKYKVAGKKKSYFSDLDVIDLKYKIVNDISLSDEIAEMEMLEKYKEILRSIAINPVGQQAIIEIYEEIQ